MTALTYRQYRQRCEALEKQLEELLGYPPKNIHQDSIDYLLTTAETLLASASSLIEMREAEREMEPQPLPEPLTDEELDKIEV